MKAIVKAAAKRLDSNQAQLRAARYGGEVAVCCMADTIAHVIGDYAQDWSSDGHFGARRSLGSGRSRSSSSSSKSDITLTEELLAQGETLEEDQEEVAAIDDNKKCDSASLEKASSSSLSADLVDSTSTQKTVKDEAVKEGVRKSGEGKRGRKKTLKKNKVSPLGTDGKSSLLSVHMSICLQQNYIISPHCNVRGRDYDEVIRVLFIKRK
ncbi:uncharacterized protein LOC123489083 [Coregonus clupeaformis]|uniref:uncharacterized protein LOC123489083 n=1 Tax=Coregonus clupeaformis TaxID=59861 RepID=UPI001E1C35BA|nr:uncharacterized protein LOC123489083 [Coregonus clupeaformis]